MEVSMPRYLDESERLSTESYADRSLDMQTEEKRQADINKNESQRIELQKQELQLQREQQVFNNNLMLGSSIFLGLVIVAVGLYFIARSKKRPKIT